MKNSCEHCLLYGGEEQLRTLFSKEMNSHVENVFSMEIKNSCVSSVFSMEIKKVLWTMSSLRWRTVVNNVFSTEMKNSLVNISTRWRKVLWTMSSLCRWRTVVKSSLWRKNSSVNNVFSKEKNSPVNNVFSMENSRVNKMSFLWRWRSLVSRGWVTFVLIFFAHFPINSQHYHIHIISQHKLANTLCKYKEK